MVEIQLQTFKYLFDKILLSLRNVQDTVLNGRKYLQIINLVRDLYLVHIKELLQFNNKLASKPNFKIGKGSE